LANTQTSESIIRQLPPEISNKIAAGEVIDRPASVVKELLDNAIDAGADQIKIIIQNAGRTLIQVIDNGCGMSEEDIRPCFERHATSKIQDVDDLFRVRTLGFRGEAMASIASVSQITVRTKRAGDDGGVEYEIYGGEEKYLKPAPVDDGSSIAVRNLFYNVPARRQFLKTDATEFRHILRAVQYAALANNDIAFELHADGDLIYQLPRQSLAARIPAIFGKNYKASLIPFEEKTSMLKLHGFAGDPKLAKKSRGEQFLFINGRPFHHRYLTHVILSLYDAWTRQSEYPFFALFFEMDPAQVDVNVHPSKMEVKFEDERSLIQLARSVVNRAINQHFSVPDVDQDEDSYLVAKAGQGFEKFDFPKTKPSSSAGNVHIPSRINFDEIKGKGKQFADSLYARRDEQEQLNKPETDIAKDRGFWQLHNRYIVSQTRTGMCMIDQHLAHKRIIYERTLSAAEDALPSTQQLLFAQTVELSASDFALLKELHPIIQRMGFSIELLSGNTALISGVPSDLDVGNEESILISMLHQYNELGNNPKLDDREKLAIAFSARAAIKRGKKLHQQEMEMIFDQLFACEQPYLDPLQKPVIIYIPIEEIQSRFRQ